MRLPDSTLEDKAVVLTGGSRGIGAATAMACATAGAESITLLGRSWDALGQVANQLEAACGNVMIVPCDVTSPESIDQAFAAVERVDVAVICAGGNRPQPFVDVDPQTFDDLFALNVRGAFFVAQAAARTMLAAGRPGVIVTMSSQMGHVGAANRTVYCATKHAIEGMTKALAVELAPAGIRAVSIAPTFIRTEMTAAQLDDPELGPQLLAQIPQGRFGTVEEVASAVVYAASPAAALMTGSSLILDGGWTAR